MARNAPRVARLAVAIVAAIRLGVPLVAQTDQWSKELAAFEEQDRTAPAIGGVVFVGSWSIRLWDLDRSFPTLRPLNRGFGGSAILDSVHHADLLVIRHRPFVE